MAPVAMIFLFAVMGFSILIITGILIALSVRERTPKTVQKPSASKTSHRTAHQS